MTLMEKIDTELKKYGHIAVYGIYFDREKAIVTAASSPTLEQISALMKQQSSLKIILVGHTDNRGPLAYNLALSRNRAYNVAQALNTQHGIDRRRISSAGVAYYSPVANNETETGRAMNRRVELVLD